MMDDLSILPWYVWTIVGMILLLQGFWIFNDANKRGMNKWLWGLLGLMNTPSNLIIYLIVSRAVLSTRKCENCGKRSNKTFEFCPHCGQDVKGHG